MDYVNPTSNTLNNENSHEQSIESKNSRIKLPGIMPSSGHRNNSSSPQGQVVGIARNASHINPIGSREKGIVKKAPNYKYDMHLKKYNDILHNNRQQAR